jgi:UDP-N-acetylmuramoyl-L-alanyl-D-glutamate--2,6-diaminopimelate ligase
VIGITGTDGKTTTTHIIYHILKTTGRRVSMMSTVYARIGDKEYDTGLHMTTPDVWMVQKLLKQAADHGDEYFVMETTSHAFDQGRNTGIAYVVGVITNITHEHLDYHKTYEAYVKAKANLIKQATLTLINRDDDSYSSLAQYKNQGRLKTYALLQKADYTLDIAAKLHLDLPVYNNYNYLAGYSCCRELGLKEEEILGALTTFTLPKGRLEVAYSGRFAVIVDFAHTPHAITQVLTYLRQKTEGRIIHVFGAAGLRDATKRPLMGYNSAAFADIIVVTEEDYRTEDPVEIAQEVAEGIEKNGVRKVEPDKLNKDAKYGYTVIINREEAIAKAISIAKPGDVVVCTGKSHEKSLCRGVTEYEWDEFAIVKKYVAAQK